jgi:hypothetical protein
MAERYLPFFRFEDQISVSRVLNGDCVGLILNVCSALERVKSFQVRK